MPKLIKITTLVPLLIAAVLPISALGQAKDRWYQVELIIFSNEGNSSSEQWEALPTLEYPNASRFLVFPAQVEARHSQHGGDSEVDEFGRQLIVFEDEEDTLQAASDIPQKATSFATDPGATASTDGAALDSAVVPILPTPFIALPHRQREFHGKSAYMQRTGKYQTLFHETWIQPVLEESRALPLIMDQSGDLQNWPRLQGSIKLHISRYLHIETNLWLNTHGEYLPGEWRMPAPPLGPPSLVVEKPEPLELTEPETTPYYVTDADDGVDQELAPEEETGPIYPWRHAVLLQQKRRMRSNEVHYIDHPLLGVVIKLTPLDEDQLLILAEAEQTKEAQ